jgi:hypothetical protein
MTPAPDRVDRDLKRYQIQCELSQVRFRCALPTDSRAAGKDQSANDAAEVGDGKDGCGFEENDTIVNELDGSVKVERYVTR